MIKLKMNLPFDEVNPVPIEDQPLSCRFFAVHSLCTCACQEICRKTCQDFLFCWQSNLTIIVAALPLHGSAQFSLFDFQLGQQIDEPLKRSLVTIYPKEINLSQIHNCLWYLTGPFVVATRTCVSSFPIAMHNRLKD